MAMANWLVMNPDFPDEMPKEGSYFFFTYREDESNEFADVRRILYDHHGQRIVSDLMGRVNPKEGGVMLWIPDKWPKKPSSLKVFIGAQCAAKGERDCNDSYCVNKGNRCKYYKDHIFIKYQKES